MLLTVIPYQESWVDQFREAAATIRGALGNLVLRVDHIGSTAVPGLPAKPVIDIQITVQEINATLTLAAALERAGYLYRPNAGTDRPPGWETQEPAEWKKMYCRTPDGVFPRTHLHLRQFGRRNQRYALLFRDYLRANARARQSYGEYKKLLGDTVGHLSRPGGTGLYLDLKDPVLDLIADAAEKWAIAVGWQQGPYDA